MSTPAKPAPLVDGARLLKLRSQGDGFAEIAAELGLLNAAAARSFYIQIIRSNANKARRSQQKAL